MVEIPGALELSEASNSLTKNGEQAICVRKAYKKYNSKSNLLIVLNDLNMTVRKGSIYGLLGASGCGKTTLLGCIVGRKLLNAGAIWVLGGRPGSRSSGVPGPRVGYMPQEVALYSEFSIRETVKYFGWINGMTTEKIEERLQFLINLLLLPSADHIVGELSGGQQRRVSLMATLLHEPELLILDEPTVGIDPIIRDSVWKHLTDLSRKENTTIILTTHYIDEARQADMIALMRGGHFLAEESPESLISKHDGASLEAIFLKLSIRQNRGSNTLEGITSGAVNEAAVLDDEVDDISGRSGNNKAIPIEATENSPADLPPEEEASVHFCDYFKVVNMSHMYALMWKNLLWMWRNLPVTIFMIGLPALQSILFCSGLGHEPAGLSISVVNYELNKTETCKPSLGCNSTRLSCNYLTYLEKRTLQMRYYANEEESKAAVRHGEAWAAIRFSHNFSDAVRERINQGLTVEDWDLASSTVNVYQDNSNGNIATYTQRNLYFAFEEFFEDHLTSCNINRKMATTPVRWEKPIYGVDSPDYTNFLSAGLIISIIFFLSLALTSFTIITERKEGILERTIVNGINSHELLFSHLITSWMMMLIQTAILLIFSFLIYGLTQNGDYGTVIFLIITTGLCGMCFGFFIACACKDETAANSMAVGTFLPMQVLCGVIWPVEAMQDVLQAVAPLLPLTQPTKSLRAVISKGWDIDNPEVYIGLISNGIWCVLFLGVSLLLLRFKKG